MSKSKTSTKTPNKVAYNKPSKANTTPPASEAIMQTVFMQYIAKLETLMNASTKQKNAGLYLYKQDARTTLFMLEALSKMFKNFHNKKRFTKMLEKFKMLEDALGQIDYYSSIGENVGTSANDKMVKKHCVEQAMHHASILHAHVLDKWVGPKSDFVKIKEKINSAKWQSVIELDKVIKAYYVAEIAQVKQLISESTFSNMENDVHEIRRKLRWLSIYPQALQGKIQLQKDAKPKLAYKSYMTKSVLASPYNKMPLKGKHASTIALYAPAYYALSYIIAELGNIKDNGLTQYCYSNALVSNAKISPAQANTETKKSLGKDTKDNSALLQEAKTMCQQFLKLGALDALLIK